MPLKTFIIQEELRAEYADRFLLYQERYHTQVLLDMKKALEKEWGKVATSLAKQHKIKDDDLEFAILQNPKATAILTVDDKAEKLVSARHREPIEVSPSVKIPLLYKREERDLIVKKMLDTAEDVIKDITDSWKEIFRVEKKGRAVPCFKVTRDHDEIRFQFALSSGSNEMYKTLYAIRVEFGKASSKLRDFDRVYLISLL